MDEPALPPLWVDASGAPPLPWLAEPLDAALAGQRGHALLWQAAPGVGALQTALVMAQSWLCEAPGPAEPATAAAPQGRAPRRSSRLACGRCEACRLMVSHTHPDLMVLVPEALRRRLAWPGPADKPQGDDSKRKPSRQIRIDEVRQALDWAVKTSGRGLGKVAVLHPAEALNEQSANALLKSLEEPAAGTRWVLTAADPSALLPTVRSRCQLLRLPRPDPALAQAWLEQQGVAEPALLLQACGGQPLQAWEWAQAGISAATWAALPRGVAAGQAGSLAAWPVPQALQALHKFCVDALAQALGGQARWFPASAMPPPGDRAVLRDAAQELHQVLRHAEHPWNEPLLIEAQVLRLARAWSSGRPAGAARRRGPADAGD